jgi:hypothetical protein
VRSIPIVDKGKTTTKHQQVTTQLKEDPLEVDHQHSKLSKVERCMAGAARKSFLYSTRADDRQHPESIEPCGSHFCYQSDLLPSKVERARNVYSTFWGQACQGLDSMPSQVAYFREEQELWGLVPVLQLVIGIDRASRQRQAGHQG